jgi:hypothetical protein
MKPFDSIHDLVAFGEITEGDFCFIASDPHWTWRVYAAFVGNHVEVMKRVPKITLGAQN